MKIMLTEQEEYHWGNVPLEKFMHYSFSTCSRAVPFPSHCSAFQILTSESLPDPDGPLGFPITRQWVVFKAIYAFPVPQSTCIQGSLCSPGVASCPGPAARLDMGSCSPSLWFIASHLSYPQHFNLVSTCHTQAYWVISLSLLILVSLTEIVITVIVCWAINYGDCKAYLFISLSIHGLIGNIHVLFSPPDNLDCCN